MACIPMDLGRQLDVQRLEVVEARPHARVEVAEPGRLGLEALDGLDVGPPLGPGDGAPVRQRRASVNTSGRGTTAAVPTYHSRLSVHPPGGPAAAGTATATAAARPAERRMFETAVPEPKASNSSRIRTRGRRERPSSAPAGPGRVVAPQFVLFPAIGGRGRPGRRARRGRRGRRGHRQASARSRLRCSEALARPGTGHRSGHALQRPEGCANRSRPGGPRRGNGRSVRGCRDRFRSHWWRPLPPSPSRAWTVDRRAGSRARLDPPVPR